MDFKTIEQYFESNNTKKVNDTKYRNYQIKWFFEGFEKIISKTTFISQISLNLDFQMSFNLISAIENEIDALREFSISISKAVQKYLLELTDEEKIVKLYTDYLNNFYKNAKDYVNEGLIPWVFAETMHYPVIENNEEYDPEKFLELKLTKFRLKIMKKMKEYLKQISNANPDDGVFKILLNGYDQEIESEDKKYRNLKKLARV